MISHNIKSKESIFNSMKFYEPVDINLLDKLIKSDLLIVNNEYNEKARLIAYRKLIKNGVAEVSYSRNKNMKYGRVNPLKSLGLHTIRREIRHTIAKDSMIDIDICNAHPEILSQICNHLQIHNICLNEYVKNRTKIFDLIIESYNINDSIDEFGRTIKPYDKTKELFIIILYGGSFKNWLEVNNLDEISKNKAITEYIYNLIIEINDITKILYSKNDDLVKNIKKVKEDKGNNKYNINSSFLSYYIQHYENIILESMYNYLVSKKIIVNNNCSLCNDGIMISKNNYNDDILDNMTKYIYENTLFKVNLKVKEMNQGFNNIDEHIIKDINSYEYKKEQFEMNHFKVMKPISFITIEDDKIISRSEKDFTSAYRHLKYIDEKEKQQSFIHSWLNDENMKIYSEIDFRPKQITPSNIYNTFKCYNVEKLDEPSDNIDINDSLIFKHLFNLCNNNDSVFNYVCMWLSRKLKNPSNLTNTALIFKSEEGTGKDIFFNWFGNSILGNDYYYNDDNIKNIIGDFNFGIVNKILIIINETNSKATFEINENIKNAITKKINTINIKNKSQYENVNNVGYIFLSNNDNPLRIPINDRRFVAIECNNSIANNHEYFTNLRNEMITKKYDKAFYNYLISLNSDSFDFTGQRPKTELYTKIQRLNTPPIIHFFEQLIFKNPTLKNMEYLLMDLFTEYNLFMTESKYTNNMNVIKFSLVLKKYEDYIIKVRRNTGLFLTIKFKDLKKYLIDNQYMDEIEIDEPIKKKSNQKNDLDNLI